MSGEGNYRKCLSLGTGCQTAHQIRTCLGQSEPSFFDWLGTPVPALITLLQKGLGYLFRDKSQFVADDGPADALSFPARHEELGVVLFHAFGRDAGLDDFPVAAAKYDALAAKWYDTLWRGGPLLFVRHLVEKQECAELSQTLKDVFPDLEFSILAVTEGSDDEEAWELPGVFHAQVCPTPVAAIVAGEGDARAWRGDGPGWLRAFELAGALSPATTDQI